MERLFGRVDSIVIQSTEVVLVVVGALFTSFICLEVISRYVFDFSIFFINALARYLLIWFFFLGAGLALRKGAHVGFELIQKIVPERFRLSVGILVHICVLMFLIEILYSSIVFLPDSFRQREGSLGVSTFWGFSAIPLGMVLMIYHEVVLFTKSILGASRKQRS